MPDEALSEDERILILDALYDKMVKHGPREPKFAATRLLARKLEGTDKRLIVRTLTMAD